MKKYSLLPFLFLFSPLVLFSQFRVSGTVTDETDGLTIIGANILVKGSNAGTTTDLDGRYELDAPGPDAVLVFTYIGFRTVEIPVDNRTRIDVVMQVEASLLDEIVVVGYGVEKRSNISGSVSIINSDEFSETPILRTEQALQGRTAGVQVAHNSGSPGSALTVRIRGVGTINNSDPLYIVDGIPVEGIDFLNPNDIESINVLKDAASSAIYGSRGANGVVLITTKGGKLNQEGMIEYNGYYGMQSPWKMINLLSAREYAIIQNEAFIAAGKTPRPEFANPDALGEGTNWLDAIFEPAPTMSHQLTLTGGSERSAYGVSANYFEQDGIVGGAKSGFERATVRFNTNHQLKKWLTVGNTLGFTWLKRQFLPENNEFTTPLVRALNMDPVTPIRKADGTYAYSLYADTDIVNPLNAIEQTHDTWRSNRLVGSVFAEIRIMEGLSVRSTYSLDATYATQNTFYPLYDLSNIPELSDAPGGEKTETNSVAIGNNTWRNWQWENVLIYKKQFGLSHDFTFTAGTTALENRHDYSGGANTNLPSNDPEDAYISNTIDPIESQSSYQGASESSLFSYFGRVNYGFANKYIVSATFRADGSSRFGRNNRVGYFPSFSAAWLISEEDFWNIPMINFLKLRGSWGRNGNDRIGNYSYSTLVYSGQNYTFGPTETITNGSVSLVSANPDLKWETSTQTDFGLDLELLEGQIGLIADYYVKQTTDMLYAAPIPLVAGTDPPIRNIGSVENKGWEFAVFFRNRKSALKYDLGGNISFVQNRVTSLGQGGDPIPSGRVQSANAFAAKTEVGHPMGSFFGYVTDGIFQSQQEVEAHAFQNEGTAAGDIRFMDLNGDNVINVEDQTYIGNPIPDFTYGLTANVEFKGFDLGVFLQGSEGNDIYNSTVRYDFTYVNRPVSVLNRWTGPGTSDFEPRANLNDPNQNARISDRFVEDGTYLRVKNVQLGYNFPKALTQRARLSKFRIYVSAQNLLTYTNYSGLDPEIGTIGGTLEMGIDRGFYPQARTLLGGISLGF